MSIGLNRKIKVSGLSFTLAQLIQSPDEFMPYIRNHFMASTLNIKPNESATEYYSRLFSAMYYRKGFGDGIAGEVVRRRSAKRPVIDTSLLLEALGVDVVSISSKSSKVVFKSTGNSYRMKNSCINKLIETIKSSKNFNRNKMDICFGVELEFIGERGHTDSFSRDMISLVGEDHYKKLLSYNHNKGNCWVLGVDGSLRAAGVSFLGRRSRGYELTSPILHFTEEDFTTLKKVIDLVHKHFKAVTNRSCGTHIHMSFVHKEMVDDDLLRHLCASYRASEADLFDRLVPATRREDRCRWCRSTSTWYIRERYQKLNISNTKCDSNICHVEFRQLDGTLDFDKIVSWVKLQKLFLELAMHDYSSKEPNPNYREYQGLLLEEVIFDDSFDNKNKECLLKMSKLVA